MAMYDKQFYLDLINVCDSIPENERNYFIPSTWDKKSINRCMVALGERADYVAEQFRHLHSCLAVLLEQEEKSE